MSRKYLVGVALWFLFLAVPLARADLLSSARVEANAKRYGEAERLLRIQLKAHGEDEAAQFLLGQVLSWQGKYADALEVYDALLRTHPQHVDYLLGKSQTLVWHGKPVDALPLLRKARRLAPEYEEVWRLQIRALVDDGSADRMRQAGIIRVEAQRRFPDSNWDASESQTPGAVVVTKHAQIAPANTTPAVISVQPSLKNEVETTAVVPAPDRRTEIEAGFTHDSLDHGLADWRGLYVTGLHRTDDGKRFYGSLRETTRFGLQDSELQSGFSSPWGSHWTGVMEATISGTHRVLPKWSLRGDVGYSLADGWLIWGGLKHAEYSDASVDLASLSLERYWGSFRAAYTLSNSHLNIGASATAHRIQGDFFYASRNRIGLGYITGQEVENLGPAGILASDIRSVFVLGTHWFAPAWAVSYEVNRHQQGSSYTRKGISLGIRHLF